jgi:hypothetical protein
MPRIYVTPQQFLSYPPAIAFTFQVQQLTNVGGMDLLMARASRRVDAFCKKRIVSPPATTIVTGIAAGQTALPVASTLGLDAGQEEAVIIGVGLPSQEIIAIVSGGVSVSSWGYPYPGSVTLASPVANNHSAGEAVQGCYMEVSTVGSSDSSDYYSEQYLQFNQDAQIAAAHAPYAGTQNLVRTLFLKNYPIVSLLKLEHMLPIATTWGAPLDQSKIGIHPSAGYLRVPLGSFILPEGLLRTTYTAGMMSVPDDIALATAYYAADELQSMKSLGAYDVLSGKTRYRYRDPQSQSTNFAKDAEAIIDKGNYRRRGP